MASDNSRDLFEARLEDAIRRCTSGSVAHIPFLTMRQRHRAERLLDARGMRGAYWFWGGHYDAERACLFLLPDYLTAILPQDDLANWPSFSSQTTIFLNLAKISPTPFGRGLM